MACYINEFGPLWASVGLDDSFIILWSAEEFQLAAKAKGRRLALHLRRLCRS
jgi:hypothetical protein